MHLFSYRTIQFAYDKNGGIFKMATMADHVWCG